MDNGFHQNPPLSSVFFPSRDCASYITGQILAVDGGFDAAGIGLPTLGACEARTLALASQAPSWPYNLVAGAFFECEQLL
jgi:hypothetical protein